MPHFGDNCANLQATAVKEVRSGRGFLKCLLIGLEFCLIFRSQLWLLGILPFYDALTKPCSPGAALACGTGVLFRITPAAGGHMAKGQKRSNREVKKPKKERSVITLAMPSSGKSSSATLSLFKKKD